MYNETRLPFPLHSFTLPAAAALHAERHCQHPSAQKNEPEHCQIRFCDDYMAYIKVAERDAVLAAQIASPSTQVTIAADSFIATVLEEAEHNAQGQGVALQEHLGSRTIADLVEQFTNDENHEWLNANDFFRGDNGDFTTIREVSESSHDIVVGESISSDASAMNSWIQPRGTLSSRWLKPYRHTQQAQPTEGLRSYRFIRHKNGLSPGTLLCEQKFSLVFLPLRTRRCYQASDRMPGSTWPILASSRIWNST